jgi:hypothetical protein
MADQQAQQRLRREVGVFAAMMMGLGLIVVGLLGHG